MNKTLRLLPSDAMWCIISHLRTNTYLWIRKRWEPWSWCTRSTGWCWPVQWFAAWRKSNEWRRRGNRAQWSRWWGRNATANGSPVDQRQSHSAGGGRRASTDQPATRTESRWKQHRYLIILLTLTGALQSIYLFKVYYWHSTVAHGTCAQLLNIIHGNIEVYLGT